jgi:hypothetical protein
VKFEFELKSLNGWAICLFHFFKNKMKKSSEFSPSSVLGLCVTLTQFSADQGRWLEKGSEISRSLQSSLFCSRINVKTGVQRGWGRGKSEYQDVKREQHLTATRMSCVWLATSPTFPHRRAQEWANKANEKLNGLCGQHLSQCQSGSVFRPIQVLLSVLIERKSWIANSRPWCTRIKYVSGTGA